MLSEKNHLIENSASVKVALEKLGQIGSRNDLTIFVTQNGCVVGSVTDGDIRRGLLNGVSINEPVEKIMFRNFRYLNKDNFSLDYLDELRRREIGLIPLLNEKMELVRIIDLNKKKSILPVDAIIMAGGEGRRLRPLTNSTPKPLIKLNDKCIIDYNIDRLESYGINNFYITVNYLKEKIREHLGNGNERGININYVEESQPLGTIGAVSKIQSINHDAVLLMNSDLLTNIDYEDFYRTFIQSGADMGVATSSYHLTVPYGIFELDGEQISSLKEKPTYTFHSNAGIYIIKKEHLQRIPGETLYNATDLLNDLIAHNKKVVHFPIRGYWLDIGQHEDYIRAQEDVKHIRF